MRMEPTLFLVGQLREIIRELNSGRFAWDLVADTAVTIAGEGLDVGELGDRLREAYEARSKPLVWRAITMTGWRCWELLQKPLEAVPAAVTDESTDRRLSLGITVFEGDDGPPLVSAWFHWPRAFYTERVAAVSSRDVRSLMFGVSWAGALSDDAFDIFHGSVVPSARMQPAPRRCGRPPAGRVVVRLSGNRLPVGASDGYEEAFLSVLGVYRDLPKLLEQTARLIDAAAGVRENPRTTKIRLYPDLPTGEPHFEDVTAVSPRGVPDWMLVSAPTERHRTRTGRVPPGGWTITHKPTGLAILRGLTRADAALAARVIAREAPCLKDVDEVVTDWSRDPLRSAFELIEKLRSLLSRKADVLREGQNVPMIAELIQYDLIAPRELQKLPPATQVALDAWLETAKVR